jgi:hypothetical protein
MKRKEKDGRKGRKKRKEEKKGRKDRKRDKDRRKERKDREKDDFFLPLVVADPASSFYDNKINRKLLNLNGFVCRREWFFSFIHIETPLLSVYKLQILFCKHKLRYWYYLQSRKAKLNQNNDLFQCHNITSSRDQIGTFEKNRVDCTYSCNIYGFGIFELDKQIQNSFDTM